MHSNRPLFSPEPSSAGEYVLVVLALLNNFHKTLRERQAQCLNKVRWGQPVIPGKHASFTIDRKHRGNPNLYDTDPNAAESDDDGGDAEIEKTSQPKSASCGNEDSNVVIHPKLIENEEKNEKFVPANEQNVPVQIENPLKLVPSLSKSFLHSNQEESPKYKTKKLKLCKKLSNKENHKQNGKLRCLRRNLFRKSQQESSSIVLPSNDESQDVNSKPMPASVSNIASNGTTTTTTTTSPDTNIAEGQEENLYPCDPLSGSLSKESPLGKKCPSPPRTPNCENGKASPLRENNPSNLCEIRSSSPVFTATDSPFRNSEFGSHLKDCSISKTEESTESVASVTNAKGMSSELHSIPQSRLLEVEGQAIVEGRQKKSEKTKQKLMVQCPLCCGWFKLKVIEKHAANCGIIAPTKQDEQPNLGGESTLICNKNAGKREPCDLNRPSESENFKSGRTRNTESDVLKTETTETESVVQNLTCPILRNNDSKELTNHRHSTSLVFEMEPIENGQTGQQTRMETEYSDLVPVLKRCFICDLSYVDGKPFSTHLRACRKKYQKLKRQFSDFSEDSEEPRRKTRSHSFLPANTKSSGETVNSNT